MCAQKHVCAHMHSSLACWHYFTAALCDDNHSVSAASQHSELLGHKREHNASKLDKAQCSFCCYSEAHPACPQQTSAKSLTDVKGASFSQRITNTHSLLHRIIPFSQSTYLAALLCISSVPSPLLICWCTVTNTCKYSEKNTKLNSAHLWVKTYSFPTEVQLPDVSHAVMYQYVLTFSPTHWLTLLLPFFSPPFILMRYQYSFYTRQTAISQFVQFKVFLLSFHCACKMH